MYKVKVVQTKKPSAPSAPKTNAKVRLSANDDYFNAVIDPFHAQRNWHLPDDYAGNTSLFKQISTVGVPLTSANAADEVVILMNSRPDMGLWILSPVDIPDNDAELTKIYPSQHLKRLRRLQKPIEDMEDLKALNVIRNLVKDKIRLRDGTLVPRSLVTGSLLSISLVPSLSNGNYAQSYWNPAASDDLQQYANLNTAIGTFSYYPRWQNDQEEVAVKDEFGNLIPAPDVTTASGIKTVSFNCNIVSGATYPMTTSTSINSGGGTSFLVVNLRKVSDDSVVATKASFTFPNAASVGFTLTASASYIGPVYLEFQVQTTTTAAVGIALNQFSCQLPENVTGRQMYRVATPDAATIMEKTQGIRTTAQSLLTSYMGSTLNDQGQIVCAKLPSDYFNSHDLSDITFDSVANLPQHYDGRLADGGHSILPPYGAQQSVFLSEWDDPLSEEALAVPRIVHVLKGGVQPLRLRATSLLEGPSVSQLFNNRPRAADPAQLARTGMACANMPTDSANAIHLLVASMALTAWKAATAAWPYIESAAHWASAFCSFIKKGVSSTQADEKVKKKVVNSKVRQ